MKKPVQRKVEASLSRGQSKDQSSHQREKIGLMKKLKLDVTTFLKHNDIVSDENIEQLKQLLEREKVLRPTGQDSCLPKKLHTKLLSLFPE